MKVNTQRLEEQARELREISYRMHSIQDSVLRTAQVLSRQTIGERFRRPIRSAAAVVEKRGDDLMKLSAALNEIARIYERAEQDIVDETEQGLSHFRPFPTGLIPIPTLPVLPIPTDIFHRQDVIYDHSRWFRDQHRRIDRDAMLDLLEDAWYRIVDPRRDYPRPRVPGMDRGELPDAEDIWTRGEGIGPVEPGSQWEDVRETFETIVVTPTPTPPAPDTPILTAAPDTEQTIRNLSQPVGPGLDFTADTPILTAAPDTQQTIENLFQPLGGGGTIGTGIGSVIDWTPWDPE